MELLPDAEVEIDGARIRIDNGILRAEVSRGRGSFAARGTRGVDVVGTLIDADPDLRVASSLDVEVQQLASRTQRRRGVTGPGSGEPRLLLSAPPLRSGEACHVVLVEEDGELRWVFEDLSEGGFVLAVDREAVLGRGVLGGQVRKTLKIIAVKASSATGEAVESFVRAAEFRHRPHRVRTFTDSDYSRSEAPEPDPVALVGGPSLLVLHGMNSSTDAAFGSMDRAWVEALCARYSGRAFAFDHPTMSCTPTESANALSDWLSARLPEGRQVELDILAYSSGGLVARELAERIPDPRVRVRSVVFVATPNSGTPLCDPEHAAELADTLTNLAVVVPDNPLDDALSIILGLVKDLALGLEPSALAGIAAMRPNGEYLDQLNRAVRTHSAYRAIAADFEPLSSAGVLVRLRDRLMGRIFAGAMNDLVVPTRSAYLSAGEFSVHADQRLVLDSSHAINHATFWVDPKVLARLDDWLRPDWPERPAAPSDPAATDPNADIEAALAVADPEAFAVAAGALASLPPAFASEVESLFGAPVSAPASTPARDAVVVLPGAMGSLLDVAGRRVWPSPFALGRGGLADLAMDEHDAVAATGLHRSYAPLVSHLAQSWDVHLFPFDWRRDITATARQLDEFIRGRVFRNGEVRPVHFVAHSMGGLVARSFIQQFSETTWQAVDDPDGSHRRGGRVVLLGTPNRGSFAAALALCGQDLLVKGLAALDREHEPAELLAIIATFTGLYQMLPTSSPADDDDRARLLERVHWGRYPVDETRLAAAGEFHEHLAAVVDASRLVQVIGDGHLTPASIRIERGAFHLGRHHHGDGRVTHESAVLEGVATYYTTASHGGLVTDAQMLGALDDLLRDGTTDALPSQPDTRRGAAEASVGFVPAAAVDPDPVFRSSARSDPTTRRSSREVASALDHAASMYLAPSSGPMVVEQLLRVSVLHASLEQARHTVMVGHYGGIPPGGAEAFLDSRLGGALSRHHDLGDYPESIGETLFVEVPGRKPRAGLVIGLGSFGELTRVKLVRAVQRAAVQLTLRAREEGEKASAIGVSAVLVSTPGNYGLSVDAAVAALIEGVARAVVEIAGQSDLTSVRLEELQIVELYEARAVEAVNAAARVRELLPIDLRSTIDLVLPDQLESGRGGRPGLATYDVSGSAWPRIVVERKAPSPDERQPATFEFTRLGGGAQLDRLVVAVDEDKVNRIIEAAVRRADAIDETAALFELLFPHEAKLEIEDTDNLHLLVDEATAAIPWELLCGRAGGHAGDALALRSGMLRQLRPLTGGTPVRRTGRPPVENHALVVGDPPLGPRYNRLPGARREAIDVAHLLEQCGYQVERCIFDDDASLDAWMQIEAALLRRPYRVVHFATHGIVEVGDPERSGLLIGADARLTAIDFRQMSTTPDLVFLNACHVGRIGGSSSSVEAGTRLNALAANLALQLMRNGVKAVIAAGWAVDDRAAAEFSRSLYGSLLGGRHFGDSVRKARTDAHDGGRTNTWGAYQCYGDPSFRLAVSSEGARPPQPVSPHELVDRLDALAVRASDAPDDAALSDVYHEVAHLDEDRVRRFDRLVVFEALARAYGELGSYADAVWAYRRAERADEGAGRMSLTALEQLCNMESRLAVAGAMSRTPQFTPAHPCADDPASLFDTAHARLQRLLTFAETAERRSLLGGLHKRRAATLAGEARRRELVLARDAYQHASDLAVARDGRFDSYSTTLWIQCSKLCASSRARLAAQRVALDALEQQMQSAVERSVQLSVAIDFWSDAAPADIALTRVLLDVTSSFDEVETAYVRAFANRSSARERSSVVEHLSDLALLVESRRDALAALTLHLQRWRA